MTVATETTAESTAVADLKIVRFRAKGFMRIDAAGLDVELNGNHLVLSGPNGSGKTSALDGLWAALGGKAPKDLPEPIHQGENEAKVGLLLRDDAGRTLNVERCWTKKSSRLVITGADGSRFSKPQELLDSLVDSYSLDPSKFLRLRPQDQVDEVLRTLGVSPPIDQVADITGEKFTPAQGESASSFLERLSADESGLFYCRRRDKGRELAQKESAIAEQHALVSRLGGPIAKSEEAATSVSDALAEIGQLQTQADYRLKAQQEAADATRRAEEKSKLLADLEREADAAQQQVLAIDAEIKALLNKQETWIAKRDELEVRVKKGQPVVARLQEEAKTAHRSAASVFDPTAKIAELRTRIASSEKAGAERLKRQQAGDQLSRLTHEKEHAEAEHAKLDLILTRLRDLRQNLLNDAALGVPGLQIEAGELRLNGVSFKQASQAQKINVACALAFRRNPKLKILRLDDAEHLDSAHRQLLLSLADKYGYRCFLTFVRDTEGLQVEVVESKASAN